MPINDREHIGKCLAYLLRHHPQDAALVMDARGWVDIVALVEGMNEMGYDIALEDVFDAVENDEKGRFEISKDSLRIRALQGHSVDVDPDLVKATPPDVLYHGTATRFAASIEETGLVPQTRKYVHLSLDAETARSVGSRHGSPLVYEVAAAAMAEDGHPFFLSRNNIWLTAAVPPKYLSRFIR